MKFKRLSKFDIVVLALCGLAVATYFYSRGPSESQMIAKYHRQKAEFEQIRLMLQKDSNVFVISERWVRAQDSFGKDGQWLGELPLNISESRLALYRERLKNLGLASVRSNPELGQVTFYQFGGGFTDTSWSIGYLWSQKPPSPLVKSAYHQMPGQNHSHYSRLQDKWYIYHHR